MLQVFVFDTRRGAREGEELEKVLAFFPSGVAPEQQQAAVGLVEALVGMTRIFAGAGAPLQSMTTAQHRHTFLEVEPGVFFVLVVEAEAAPPSDVRAGALRAVLKETYAVWSLLHGSVRALLDADGTAETARRLLRTAVADLGTRMTAGKHSELSGLGNALSAREGLPTLPLDRQAFLNVQFVVNALTTCCGGALVQEVVVLHDVYLVWSGLRVDDTYAVYRYAARCLLPAVVAAAAKRGKLLTEPPASPPFRAGDWRPGGDGFLEADGGGDAALVVLHVDGGDMRCELCVLQRDSLTLLLLLRPGAAPDAATRAQLAAVAEQRLPRLVKLLTSTAGSLNRWHVPGYRYLHLDRATLATRASPESKVATLAPESLAALAQLRAYLDERGAAAGGTQEHEICIRTLHDAWVVMRRGRGRELFVILERAGDTLLEASEATDRFCESLDFETF